MSKLGRDGSRPADGSRAVDASRGPEGSRAGGDDEDREDHRDDGGVRGAMDAMDAMDTTGGAARARTPKRRAGPNAFCGRELSCRPLSHVFARLEAAGLPHERLTAGLDYPLAHLLDPTERIDWTNAARLCRNARAIWSDEQLVRLGGAAIEHPALRWLGLIARLLFSIEEYYGFATRQLSHQVACFEPWLTPHEPGHLQIQVTISDGYDPIPELVLALRGALETLPTVLGLPSAEVSVEDLGTIQVFDVRYVPRRTWLAGVRRFVTWPFTARAAARELHAAHDLLHARHADALRAARALRSSEQQFRSLMEQASDAIVISDGGAKLLAANEQACRILGYGEREILSRALDEIMAYDVDPLDRADADALACGRRILCERRVRTRFGALLPVEMSMRRIDDGRIQAIFRDISGRRRVEAERLRYAAQLEEAVRSRTQELEHSAKQMRELQMQLIRAQRLGAAEDVAASIAHALNNPLGALIGTLQMLAEKPDPTLVRRALRIAERLRAVARQTLQLFREGSMEPRLEDPVALVRAVREALGEAARANGVRIRLQAEPGLPALRVDPALMTVAIQSVAENAIEAMPDGGALRFELRFIRELDVIQIDVVDHGPGIPHDIRDQIFEPFFTTKPAGTGLGLAIAQGIVQGHSGRIELLERPDGTTARIELRRTFS